MVGESDTIPVSLDGTTIQLPTALVQPTYREFFDRIVDWAYDEARDAQRRGTVSGFSKADADSFLDGTIEAFGITLPQELYKQLSDALFPLAHRMAELAVAGRNGIWAFILRNTYRPGLLTGHFNGLVSNPPWLAMSGLADNPYRDLLKGRAKLYGIQPAGQSFLHLELGTMHLLHAIDRYLGPDACVACLVPGTVLNGNHHERLRRHDFLASDRPVPFDIAEVWQVAPGTFKYPGAALVGHKRADTTGLPQNAFTGFVATEAGLDAAGFSVRTIGSARSAWVLEKGGSAAVASGGADLPQQGADLMPRTAVCVDIVQNAGPEYRVDTPTRASAWGFTIKSAKELAAERFPGHVAPRFIYRMAQSENLLPFVLGAHRAPMALPALRAANGTWSILDETEIRRQGFTHTARRFAAINQKLKTVGKGKTLQQRIDERGKLSKQVFGAAGHLILAGAGGKIICAACLPVAQAQDLVVDQTLYWKVVADENEAWYQVGMLNSVALTNAKAVPKAARRTGTADTCRSICPAWNGSSSRRARCAPAGAARWQGSVKMFPSGWTWCRPSSACWSPVVRNTPAGAVPAQWPIVVQTHRPTRPEVTRELVEEWYRDRAHIKFPERIELCLGLFPDPEAFRPKGLIVRQIRQRWGSMSPAGRLLLNRRLVQAPVDAIDYVITHELCHVAEPHHGPAFFELLDKVMPDWERRKQRLERAMA